ncbi:acyl-CoA dehydrogenase [Clostridium estertheticum]|uniref:Acyl-CoA dehydrogenase n=2 Tax=Clostridium estertheticum TaxID=238834 RepID=A0A5N7IUU0_9CLOT|nr:acyl-CoA dehydrogenase [Clostridium estertheticum]MPQ64865.1 acyl-CoA dehydrogenase [Clostridium estertheticum]
MSVMPIDFLTDEERVFCEQMEAFSNSYVAPYTYEMDKEGRLKESVIKDIINQGLMKIEIPEEYGGLGKPFMYSILAIEKLAIVDPAVSVFVDVQNTLVINALMRWGNDNQKQKYLTKLAHNTVGAFSITESESGSDAAKLNCTAEKVHGGYILNGQKHWVTNAAEADIFLIFAKISDISKNKVSKDASLTSFIVDKSELEGITVEKAEEKMGIRASSTCDVNLKNVFVPNENVLGSVGEGLRVALETLTDGRIGISAQMLGLAQGAFECAIKYAQQRKQFGKYISTYQGIQFPIAQMATEIQAVRLLVYNVARMKVAKYDFKELMLHSSMAKLYASQVADRVVSQSLEIIGGKGYMKGNEVEKLYRDCKIGAIYEGTSNIQLLTIARNFVKI